MRTDDRITIKIARTVRSNAQPNPEFSQPAPVDSCGNGTDHSADSAGASGSISANHPNASLSANVAAQKVEYSSQVPRPTPICTGEPTCASWRVRQCERSRTPGLVSTIAEPPNMVV